MSNSEKDHPYRDESTWTAGKRVSRPDGSDAGAIVETGDRIKVKWDGGASNVLLDSLQPAPRETPTAPSRPTFQVQSVQYLRKKAWIIVRFEPDFEPIMVGLHYSDPALALTDANRLNVYASARANA